jgi:colanic acid/amylovoran biosynthesis glycosyltransferase
MKLNLAIFSPKQDSYSETFIQAHKNLPFNVRYYFGDALPTSLEGGKSLLELSMIERAEKKWKNEFSVKEYGLLFSLKREKIDVVLAEYADTAVKTLDIIKFLGIPLVVHFHGYDASIHEVINSYADKYRQVFEYASSVIAVSKKMVSDIRRLGCPFEKIVYCPYGPNNNFFRNSPSFTNHQFVFVGRFVEKKAPHLTLLAFEKVSREYPEAKLIMIGDGPLLNVCLQMVEALGLSKKVTFAGVQHSDYIANVFEQSRALVQHSVTAKEW